MGEFPHLIVQLRIERGRNGATWYAEVETPEIDGIESPIFPGDTLRDALASVADVVAHLVPEPDAVPAVEGNLVLTLNIRRDSRPAYPVVVCVTDGPGIVSGAWDGATLSETLAKVGEAYESYVPGPPPETPEDELAALKEEIANLPLTRSPGENGRVWPRSTLLGQDQPPVTPRVFKILRDANR